MAFFMRLDTLSGTNDYRFLCNHPPALNSLCHSERSVSEMKNLCGSTVGKAHPCLTTAFVQSDRVGSVFNRKA